MSEDKPDEISFDDRMRGGIYGLLGVLMSESPDQEQLIQIAGMRENESDMGKAMGMMAKTAAATDPAAVAAEFKTLFSMMLKPVMSAHASDPATAAQALAEENARLGVTPFESEEEPADHIAALCDTMASLILSQNNEGLSPDDNKKFFNACLADWAEGFFAKLEGKRTAKFYGPVGSLGKAFFASEAVVCAGEGG